jgi:hypothetical protein
MNRVPYTTQSIEHGFAHHESAGRIKSWRPGDRPGRYVVTGYSRDADPIELRSLRECWIYLNGLMTGIEGESRCPN